IFERPRPLSRQRRADDLYTLNCEEPVILGVSWQFNANHRNAKLRVLCDSNEQVSADSTRNAKPAGKYFCHPGRDSIAVAV
ncbi:hypothetical protein ACJH6H_25190, partial [Mycobacterium sp. SMC-21]|uniref:hypothetical protein n=1 Tax=Mycobacterium sp. SMC-21 TaxID=3381632 RepID=UPI0038766548